VNYHAAIEGKTPWRPLAYAAGTTLIGQLVPKCQIILDFAAARDDGGDNRTRKAPVKITTTNKSTFSLLISSLSPKQQRQSTGT